MHPVHLGVLDALQVHACMPAPRRHSCSASMPTWLLTLPTLFSFSGRYGEHSRQRLDLALLSFFQNFRKVYVGEQVGVARF